ncbi:MAG: DUF6029 family protein [Rhodothermaceae bacterium]
MKKVNIKNLILLLCFVTVVSGQTTLNLPEGLGVSNQMEYSYDSDKKQEIFENWLNLDYSRGIFSAGIRFDIFQPNDPNPLISRGKDKYADISYKYIGLNLQDGNNSLDITVGNFYSLFGRGMLLKSYEDRNLRVDNNLLGVMLDGRYRNLRLKALTGMAENSNADRKDVLHAVNLEYKFVDNLKMGASYVSNKPEIDELARTSLASVRIEPSFGNFDLYAEYGVKMNDDITRTKFNGDKDVIGKSFYGNFNFYVGSFSLVSEYKYYDNFVFASNDGTVIYNTPPSLRKDLTYILLNRHPSPLNQNNEKGYKFEANYEVNDELSLTAEYAETKSLDDGSLYQQILGTNNKSSAVLKEYYFQADKYWGESVKSILVGAYNEEMASNTENLTFIFDNSFYLDDENTIKFVFEHQQTKNNITSEEYFDDIFLVEWQNSPSISIAFVSEMKTTEPSQGNKVRRFWNYLQFGYNWNNHTDINVTIGNRQAGNICIGGICRYEPEFNGVELKMVTRL